MPLAQTAGDPTWQRVLQVLPALLWPLVIVLALLLFRRKIADKLSDITSVKVAPFEARFAERLAEVQQSGTPASSPAERRDAIGRAYRAREWCVGKRILWVDDHPGTNHQLGELFRQVLGVSVRYALTTDEAMTELLTDSGYTAVITDMVRGDDDRAGLRLIERMRAEHVYRPTIIYSMRDSAEAGVPAGAFGRTNRADPLRHYVIDACERA
jgi:CheY-like chemotaxis protein